MKIVKQLTELIGNTPLLELTNYEREQDLKAKIVVKLEYFNPLGSVKDRVANAMIEQGIKDGKINQDTIIIEPTSGNTGIGLAFVCAAKGLHTDNAGYDECGASEDRRCTWCGNRSDTWTRWHEGRNRQGREFEGGIWKCIYSTAV